MPPLAIRDACRFSSIQALRTLVSTARGAGPIVLPARIATAIVPSVAEVVLREADATSGTSHRGRTWGTCGVSGLTSALPPGVWVPGATRSGAAVDTWSEAPTGAMGTSTWIPRRAIHGARRDECAARSTGQRRRRELEPSLLVRGVVRVRQHEGRHRPREHRPDAGQVSAHKLWDK
jgi:hypothetical protein